MSIEDKKELCIAFLDNLKNHAELIEAQSQIFKKTWDGLNLSMKKDWILKTQSKIRDRLHTGNVGFTNWCYERIVEFSERKSSKFSDTRIFGALRVLGDDEIPHEQDIRQIFTVIHNILGYDDFKEEEKEKEEFKDIDDYYEEHKAFYLTLPEIGSPSEVPAYTERYKKELDFAKKHADRYRSVFRYYNAYLQIAKYWEEINERRL